MNELSDGALDTPFFWGHCLPAGLVNCISAPKRGGE